MEKKNLSYAVMGATGHIGKPIAEALLKTAKEVRVIGRGIEKLKPLTDQGAKAYPANFDDTRALREAFTGVDAVFVMTPPDYTTENYRAFQNKIGEAVFQALKDSGVKNIVNLSSVGAHLPEGTGVVNGLYDQEQRLNQLQGVNLVHLRPPFFLENQLAQIPLIKAAGIMGSTMRADLAVPAIATQDIAARAAELLANLDFKGVQIQELHGQRDVTMPEVVKAVGQAIGKPDLQYVQFSTQDAENGMVAGGLSRHMAQQLNALNQAFNEGRVKPTQSRSARTTTPTSIEEFAKFFAAVYRTS